MNSLNVYIAFIIVTIHLQSPYFPVLHNFHLIISFTICGMVLSFKLHFYFIVRCEALKGKMKSHLVKKIVTM